MTKGRVYAVSDLHGNLNLLQQIQKFLKPKDKVYCLGDCGDRGPEPWNTIKEVLRDDRFIYLMGNHEKMLVDAIEEYYHYGEIDEKFYLLCQNGGYETFYGWQSEKFNSNWYQMLKTLPYSTEYKNESGYNILLSHAGYTPGANPKNRYDLIWSRSHFYDSWPEGHDMDIIIHGHTPIPYMVAEFEFFTGNSTPPEGAFWYAKTHKIDIDPGTISTNKTILIDLNTFEEHIFKVN